jgi:hypothetical protein
MASFMLKHDGVLNRWCPVQEDTEEYFRKTLGEVWDCHMPCSCIVLYLAQAYARACRTRL